MLGKVLSYVDDVLAGRRAGDASVCRYLADTLALVPRIKPADFEALFNGQVQVRLVNAHCTPARHAL